MTVALTGAGSLGVRLGHLGQALNDANSILGGALTVDGRAADVSATMVTKTNTVTTDFAAGTAQYALIDTLQSQLASYQGSASAFKTYLKSLAQALLIKMVDDDTPLASKDVTSALKVLIQQMVTAAASFKANVPAAGAQTSLGSPTGTPAIVSSVKSGAGTYSGMEYMIAETVRFVVSTDAVTGGATANQESLTATGKVAASSPLDYNWPLGSGASQTYTVVDPQLSNNGGNVLQNSGFDTWDSTHLTQPDNFVRVTGTAGTDFTRETSTVFGGSAGALKLVGNAGSSAALVDLRQTFNTTPSTVLDSGGTSYNIGVFPGAPAATSLPATPTAGNQFALSFWIKADIVPAAGVVTVDLVDGSGTVINDDAGTANSTAITLSGITTSYVQKTAIFRLPFSVPTVIKLRIRTTTAISTSTNIYIDDLALAKMIQLYTAGGPYFAVFRGATKPLIGDTWTVALTISAAGAFQRLFQKFFDIHKLNLFLPSKADASETVVDTLIS